MRRRALSLVSMAFLSMAWASSAHSLEVEEVRKRVAQLFSSDESHVAQEIRVAPTENHRFVVELLFNIGNRWGKEGFAKDLAKATLERLFRSDLPVAQGIVRIYANLTEVLHLGIGLNQADKLLWENPDPSRFFESLRSSQRLGEKPEDRTYITENKPLVKPSPAIFVGLDSLPKRPEQSKAN